MKITSIVLQTNYFSECFALKLTLTLLKNLFTRFEKYSVICARRLAAILFNSVNINVAHLLNVGLIKGRQTLDNFLSGSLRFFVSDEKSASVWQFPMWIGLDFLS